MENSFFPGYGRCVGCKELISDKDIHTHTLNCRTKPSNEKKLCSLCNQQVDVKQLKQHMQTCNQLSLNQVVEDVPSHSQICEQDQDMNTGYQTPRASTPTTIQIDTNLCQEEMDQSYANETKHSIEIKNLKERKFCGLCQQEIDEDQYRQHVAHCQNERTNKKIPKKKFCTFCHQSFDENEFVDHVQVCLNDIQKSPSQMETNFEEEEKRYSRSSSIKSKRKKQCTFCFEYFCESEYVNHATICSTSLDNITTTNSNKRYDQDLNNNQRRKGEKDCFICFKSIDESEYSDHVTACVVQLDKQSSISTRNKKLICVTCNRSINKEDKSCYEMLCHCRHNHCLSCLTNSMEEFARNRQTPICHRTLCDYELSRYDISLIPLERRLSDRLLKLAKGEQRPLCSKCHFYVAVNEYDNFDEHFEMCGDLIPCEYCQLPFPFQQLETHAIQCANDRTSFHEKLINFILPRTKYPFTKQQITIFIQNHRNKTDPFSIIEALAEFGPTFPYEIPTRECGICLENRPYDDIYVFDCDESHKTCYDCYYQSCQTKMNSGQMLTCAICTYSLRDGELNQLRIPNDQLKIIRDYQMKKTFDIYSSRTRGIIKCPNQNCTWVAEAEDPNERFRVQCPKCQKEFCSLCNQQYHYRTNCQQLPQITQRWFFWCETERQRYLTMRAQQDQQYAQQLDQYNKQTNDNNNRNKDLRRRYEELMNDEQYKAQNCRLCPSCKRVVQRLEGCDSMVCGQDAHGGNLQSGCGTKFNWAQAQPYAAAASKQPKQTIIDLPKPDNPVVHHDGVKCDHCQNDVNGIRFDCVHCPALTFCEKCEREATLNHSRENQAFQQQQHVFKLIMIPQEEANQL